jgi:nucleoside-diphosphate-sugar epimerase
MILITGHRGFVGGHLCSYFDSHGIKWTGIDLKEDKDILTADLPEAERVYHLAAQTDAQTDDVWDDADTNIFGTLRIMDRYKDRAVFASSWL